MYTKEIRPKYFVAVPIYDIITNKLLNFNETEKKRVEEIQLMSTRVMVGKEIGIKDIKKAIFLLIILIMNYQKKKKIFVIK